MRSFLSCSSHLGHGFPIWHFAFSFIFRTFAIPYSFILLLVNLYSNVFVCFLFSLMYRSDFLAHTHVIFSHAAFRTTRCFTRKLVLVLRPPKEVQWMVEVTLLKTSHPLPAFVFPSSFL